MYVQIFAQNPFSFKPSKGKRTEINVSYLEAPPKHPCGTLRAMPSSESYPRENNPGKPIKFIRLTGSATYDNWTGERGGDVRCMEKELLVEIDAEEIKYLARCAIRYGLIKLHDLTD